jgi:hypothetical protein
MRPFPLEWSRCQWVLTMARTGSRRAAAKARMPSLCHVCLPVSTTMRPSGAARITVLPSGPRLGRVAPASRKVCGAISRASGGEGRTAIVCVNASATIRIPTLICRASVTEGRARGAAVIESAGADGGTSTPVTGRILATMKATARPTQSSLGPLPHAIVTHLTATRGEPTPHLLVDGQPQVRQDGWTLGISQIEDDAGEGHLTDVEVCLLRSGAVMTSVATLSGDGYAHTAHVNSTPADAAAWLDSHCHGVLEAPARAAWRQACEALPALLTLPAR